MAIKRIRTLAGKDMSVPQLAREVEGKRLFYARMRMITIGLLVVAVLIALYYYFSPPTGVVQAENPVIELRSPVAAEVREIFNSRVRRVHKGDKLAVLFISASVNAVAGRDFVDPRIIDRGKLDMDMTMMRFALDIERLRQDGIRLRLQLKLAQEGYARSLNQLNRTEQIMKAEKSSQERAERLWNLDAIPVGDLYAARKSALMASADYENARIEVAAAQAELAAAELLQKTTDTNIGQYQKRYEELTRLSRSRINAPQGMIGKITETGDGYTVELLSPIDGVVIETHAVPGAFVERGDTVISVADPNLTRLFAYVKSKYIDDIAEKQTVKVRMGGTYFPSEVSFVMPSVVPGPVLLRSMRLLSPESMYIKVELNKDKMPDTVVPGEIGTAVFRD